jgi:hypothetical protein
VRHKGTDGRGAGHRRMQRSLVGTHEAEEVGAPVGEAMGGGGRGAHRWWGGARRSRKRRSLAGVGRGVMLGNVGSGVAVSFGQRGVGWVARGRSGGQVGRTRVGSIGRAGGADARGVGRLSAWGR